MNIDVSIIIPIYNVQDYLTECLDSVALQTYQGSMECLLVDDCGTDDSIVIANNYIKNYNGSIHFRILHHTHNRGLSAARNTGVAEAKGTYIYFLDSDDAITHECIEKMMDLVKSYPHIELVQAGFLDINGKDIYNIRNKNLPDYCEDPKWIKNNLLLSNLLPGSSWNKLIKRQFLIDNNITQVEGIIYEDAPYSFYLAQKLKNIGFCKYNTYLYRIQRTGSITDTAKEERSLQSRLIILNYCLDLVDNRYKDVQLRSIMLKCINYLHIHSVTILQEHIQEIAEIIKRIKKGMPYPWKIATFLYAILPLQIKHSSICTKVFKRVF